MTEKIQEGAGGANGGLEPFRVVPSPLPDRVQIALGGVRWNGAFADKAEAQALAQAWSAGPSLEDIRWYGRLSVSVHPNYWLGLRLAGEADEYAIWGRTLESGRSYLYGSSRTIEWMVRRAVHMTFATAMVARRAWMNPWEEYDFTIRSGRSRHIERDYRVRRRGEYVEIELPHHDAGGEKTWVTRDLKRMVLVNVD